MERRSQLSRRDFLAGTAALTTAVAGWRDVAGFEQDSPPTEISVILELSATDAVRALREGDLTAENYARALLDQCAAGESLNVFITFDPDVVLESARAADRGRASGADLGILHGLPVPVKDSVHTSGFPTTGGTRALGQSMPADDAPVVAKLREAGAFVMGKTNLHELSLGWSSNNRAFGPVRNPYDPTRIPGGSSGGTSAAIAARMAPLGVSEDTGGSIRIPAALCGICGFRPSTGRYPNAGVVPVASVFDQVGPAARTVADLALFDSVFVPTDSPVGPVDLDGVRLGVDRAHDFATLHPEVARITENVLQALQAAGATLVEREVPRLSQLVDLITFPLIFHDVVLELSRYLRESSIGISFDELLSSASEDIRANFDRYKELAPSAEQYEAIRTVHLPALKETFRSYFQEGGIDARVFPTTLVPPVLIDRSEVADEYQLSGETVTFGRAMSRNILPGSTAGCPGLVVPAGLTADGLPVGVEFDAAPGRDRMLLGLGLAIEAALEPLPPPRLGTSANGQ